MPSIVRSGALKQARRPENLEAFMDPSAPMDVAVRQKYCPFCEPDKVSSHGFVVTRMRNGYSMWCHRCHTKWFVPCNGQPLSVLRQDLRTKRDRENSKQLAETVVKQTVVLPSDFTLDIPASGLLWLRTYGVTDAEIKRYRFGYSPSLDRLILPVFREEGLVFWQGRNLSADTTRHKYLNVRTGRSDVVMTIRNDKSEYVVVVEDILSALAVARAGYNAIALLGSYVNFKLLTPVLSEWKSKKIRIWLDADKRKECCKYSRQLSAIGINSAPIILPTKDPKEYNNEDITKFVEGVRHVRKDIQQVSQEKAGA